MLNNVSFLFWVCMCVTRMIFDISIDRLSMAMNPVFNINLFHFCKTQTSTLEHLSNVQLLLVSKWVFSVSLLIMECYYTVLRTFWFMGCMLSASASDSWQTNGICRTATIASPAKFQKDKNSDSTESQSAFLIRFSDDLYTYYGPRSTAAGQYWPRVKIM